MMKNTLVMLFCFAATASVFAQDVNAGGKTYYYYDESTKKRVKEVFHFIELIQIMPDKKNPGNYIDTLVRVKHGPYTCYFENGKLMTSGYYRDGQPDSIWIYYTAQGTENRRELYRNGKVVK